MELMVDQTAQSFSPLRHGSRRRSMQYSMSPKKTSYAVQVTYEGRSCTIAVEPGETILAAMERTGVSDPLCLPLLPQDCRRGNCLTCTGRHGPGSQPQSLASIGDGLSPHMSDQVSLAGYVLTCCATVTGPGVHLTLGENEGAWRMMHQTRLRDDEAKRVHQESVARVMTLRAERNVPRWAKETEDVLKKTPEL
jgi:ferredoxin